eukprot:TRINITY_DN37570_c0_g1_i1.p1 TRINITY_DN37570_c0_g1~~TRINITY_DN37570_c0_g1_i1.p1  ORF type:complete len:497 (+),score=56.93 TRINITY_DN37570_c0_g1_i1:54-1544(+)
MLFAVFAIPVFAFGRARADWTVAAATVAHFVMQTRAMEVEVTVSYSLQSGASTLTWTVTRFTAEEFAFALRTARGGDGLFVHTPAGEVAIVDSGGGVLKLLPSQEKRFLPWKHFAGFLHAVAASVISPFDLFHLELEKTWRQRSVGHAATVGVFLLRSLGREMWRMLAKSLMLAWSVGSLASARLHVLVHQMETWDPEAWRKALGPGAPHLFGGLHWCGGPNRFHSDATRLDNNYLHKVFTMLTLAVHLNYTYLTSLDDDVLLPASALAYLVNSGPEADSRGCGLVVPLLQNGVPSAETWAETFLDVESRETLYRCFSGSSARWVTDSYSVLEPLPTPWNGFEWYNRLARRLNQTNRGVHPVRGNETCMSLSLSFALGLVANEWPRWRTDHSLLVDVEHRYPYVVNYAFLIRTDRYKETIDLPWLDGASDEVPLNLMLLEQRLPSCFVSGSFGVHPAYSTHSNYKVMEHLALKEVSRADRRHWRQLNLTAMRLEFR